MIDINYLKDVDLQTLIVLGILTPVGIIGSIYRYHHMSEKTKQLKGYKWSIIVNIVCLFLLDIVIILQILFDLSFSVCVPFFVIYFASFIGVAYGKQVLLQNKSRVDLSDEKALKIREQLPYDYFGAIIITFVVIIIIIFW